MEHIALTADNLDAALTRLEAKVDALPSRAFIAGALVRAVVVTTAAMALGLGLLGGFAFLISR